MHVRSEHVVRRAQRAAGGPVAQGNVGGGTGMICHGFKGGHRHRVAATAGRATRSACSCRRTTGAARGSRSTASRSEARDDIPLPGSRGDAARRLDHRRGRDRRAAAAAPVRAPRPALGARDRAHGRGRRERERRPRLAFSTGNRDAERGPVDFVANEEIDPLFYATIEATEEAIVNALLNAETMSGRSGTVHALPHDRLTALIASSER